MGKVQGFTSDEIRLPSPPAIAVRIIDIVKGENFSFKQLASVIQADPALLARVLRLANSGLYGRPKKISNIDTAVTVLGGNTLKNIALSFIILEAFNGKEKGHTDFDRFWRRSLTAAVAGDLVATAAGIKSDDTFITNLLQDIGIIATFVSKRDSYLRVLEEKAVRSTPLATIEREILGYDHQEVGMELLKRWGLPESIYLPIRHHHDPDSAPAKFQHTCGIMRVADRLSAIYYGNGPVRNIQRVKQMLSEMFNFGEQQATQLIDAVAEKSAGLQAQFEISPDQIRPFSQILQEANYELSRLNLSYEFLLIENREAKERAERLAQNLKTANGRLHELAVRDGLTGLFNHRHFMEVLDTELARSLRYERPLSLIMFDVDHFKAINDTFDHLHGDAVLKAIADALRRNHRKSDVVARYGGEEFVMILPETGFKGALAKAEACRKAVENIPFGFVENPMRATISAGIALWEPQHGTDKYKLIAAADRALYLSKRSGRNRVSFESEFNDSSKTSLTF